MAELPPMSRLSMAVERAVGNARAVKAGTPPGWQPIPSDYRTVAYQVNEALWHELIEAARDVVSP